MTTRFLIGFVLCALVGFAVIVGVLGSVLVAIAQGLSRRYSIINRFDWYCYNIVEFLTSVATYPYYAILRGITGEWNNNTTPAKWRW